MRKRILPAVLVVLAPSKALAADWVQWFDEGVVKTEPNQRRSDVTIGASLGLLAGAASGFPNEADKINVGRFETSTGFATGGFGALWLGGALRDWLTVGVGGGAGRLAGSDVRGTLGAFLFRVEAFPLVAQGSALADLGVYGNFGLGTLSLERDGRERADGGAMSLLGIGVLHETFRLRSFALGPSVEYTYFFSQTATVHTGEIGVRVAFYGGP